MTGVRRRRGRCLSQSAAVVYLENGLTMNHQIKNLHTGRFYNRTGYEVTIYFRSEVIDVRKTSENDASDGFNLESLNWHVHPHRRPE